MISEPSSTYLESEGSVSVLAASELQNKLNQRFISGLTTVMFDAVAATVCIYRKKGWICLITKLVPLNGNYTLIYGIYWDL